jgi:hypothetical protein
VGREDDEGVPVTLWHAKDPVRLGGLGVTVLEQEAGGAMVLSR